MKFLSWENQADITAFLYSTSRYTDDLLNIDNDHFEQMVDRIYTAAPHLNKTNSSDSVVPCLHFECISI